MIVFAWTQDENDDQRWWLSGTSDFSYPVTHTSVNDITAGRGGFSFPPPLNTGDSHTFWGRLTDTDPSADQVEMICYDPDGRGIYQDPTGNLSFIDQDGAVTVDNQ